METFWLLFLLHLGPTLVTGALSFDLGFPLGIYLQESRCREDGEQLTKALSRKFECRPATQTVLDYYAKGCLSDNENLKFKLLEAGLCGKPSEVLQETIRLEMLKLEFERLKREMKKEP